MDLLVRKERRRLERQLVYQQIIREREREHDRRRRYYSIIHHDLNRPQRHYRSYSQLNDSSDQSDEQIRHRCGSLSRHSRSNESKECSLVILNYHGIGTSRHSDEINIVQHGQTVYKGVLKRGDQFTFKSQRYRNEMRIKLEIYVNDILEDEFVSCCEHSLINQNQKHFLQIERILGSKPCQQCQYENKDNSSSFSSSSSSSDEDQQKPQRSPIKKNNNNNNNSKVKSTKENQVEVKSEKKKKPTTLNVPQTAIEKACSEGFSADISDLSDFQALTSHQTEDESNTFQPVLSSTDRESPPPMPPKRIYGPPQLSTMLSISEPPDSPFESTNETHDETDENSRNKSSNLINSQAQRRDSDDEDNQIERRQFLQSMSSNVENNSHQQTPSINVNSSRGLAMADDATQLLLTRLGIVRQQQIERSESMNGGSAPREQGNVEDFIIVYLNSTHPNDIYLNQLRSIINFIKIFDDIDDCMAFINNIINEKIIFISSNSFSSSILPKIEDLQQILMIYILSDDEQDTSDLLNHSTKIKGLYDDFNELCQQISNDIDLITRDLATYINISSNSTSIDLTLIYFQLISEVILDNEETENSLKELIHFAREEYKDNPKELTIIDEFENDYEKNRAVWWFTRKCFLSKMLNKALRVPEADVLFRLRLFIQHLNEQIQSESISNTDLTVYLGQTIHSNDLDNLDKSLINNNLLVFNQYLTGSTDLSNAIQIARNLPRSTDDYQSIILQLNISSNFKCANTSSLRYYVDDKNDVLLNMGFVGKLNKIEREQQNQFGITTIYLTLVNLDDEQNIREILADKRKEVKGAAPLVTLIKLMLMMNQQARAEHLILMIFNDEFLKSDANLQGSLAASCHIVGAACHARGDYKRAVELFHLSLETFLRFVPADAVQLSPTYNNIGSMYFRQEEYEKAAEYHQKALDVQIKSHNPNLNSIASYSNNVGVVHLKQGKYNEAAKSFERALKILQQINEPNDPDLASTYDNLGDAYLLQDRYDQALNYYSKALEVQRLIQPRNPQALASFNNSIGNIYNKLHRYGDALFYFKRSLEYQLEYLPPTHPSFASLYNNIGSMYYRQEQYADALPCYLKSLEIELMCLPENHPTIAVTHFNIATTYTGLGRFQDAILSTERSIEQLLKTLPSNHPEIAENRSYIDTIKRKQMLKGLFDTTTTDS